MFIHLTTNFRRWDCALVWIGSANDSQASRSDLFESQLHDHYHIFYVDVSVFALIAEQIERDVQKGKKKRTMRIYGLTRGRHIIWIMLNRIVKCDRNFVCRASERPKDESINLSSTSEKEESESSSNRLLWCVRTSKIATLITTSFSESDKNKNVLKITWYFDCAEY